MNNKNQIGLTAEQLSNGTPQDKIIILKAFYKGDKATISPAKDGNGRYKGIQENIPEIKKLEMGYMPEIDSKVKIYDDIEIDLNDPTWKKDWEWMQYCAEIADDFATGQATPGAYFYVHRPGLEAAKKVNTVEEEVKLLNYILNDSPENLYNRASILGTDMSGDVISEVKDFLLNLAKTEPHKIKKVYESKTFSLELLLMHALNKDVIAVKNGTYTFGSTLLGVDKRAVISFFANPKNTSTTRAIEGLTYGTSVKEDNPLEGESVEGSDLDFDETPSEDTLVNESIAAKLDDKGLASVSNNTERVLSKAKTVKSKAKK